MTFEFRSDKGRQHFQNKDSLHFKNKDPSHFDHKPVSIKQKLSKFCSNSTAAQAYLTQILSVIKSLEANPSYNSILKTQSANFITYLKDTKNQELLHSDCEGFIKGLQAAKKADKEAERSQNDLVRIVQKQIKQAARDVTSGKGFHELDS
jgi:hypothetical protein